MIEFKKLTDKEYQAKVRAEIQEEQSKLTEIRGKQDAVVSRLLAVIETLSDSERSLVRSCRFRLTTRDSLSDAQWKWVKDIDARIGSGK